MFLVAALAAVLEGTWSTAPALKVARAAHAVAATPTAIYALGGTGASGKPVLDVERFDGEAWSIVSKLPSEGLNAPAAAALGERIFLIGGFGTTSNVPIADVHVLDTLPAGVTFGSASAGCTQSAGQVDCALGTLASGAGAAVTITVTPRARGVITNTARVGSSAPDPNTANNSATTDTTVSR